MDKAIVQPVALPGGKVRFSIDTGRNHVDILISEEDLAFVSMLNIKAQMTRGVLRLAVWAGRKSIALSRFIKEGYDPHPSTKQLVVRHKDKNTLNYTRENLVWSTARKGPICINEEPCPDPYVGRVITWKGDQFIFNTREEAVIAKSKLEAGYPACMIHETGRKRSRGLSRWIKNYSKEWGSWLAWRKLETAEIVEWLSGARNPRAYETEGLKQMFIDGWEKMESDSCLMLAVATAEWMTRRTQDVPEMNGRNKTLDRNHALVLREMDLRDPFEELDNPFAHGCDDPIYTSMPKPKGGTFILTKGLEE